MPLGENPFIKRLLSWHGHRGGVRVPFQGDPSPLDTDGGAPSIIVTRLIARLRDLAVQLAAGMTTPRLIFLVGGPGNGKSEAVQDFLTHLDTQLGCEGGLATILRDKFTPAPLLPWVVEVGSDDVTHLPGSFSQHVGRLVVVQDASASERPYEDAAQILSHRLQELIHGEGALPLLICCVNRGLLTRCLRAAHATGDHGLTAMLEQVIRATALGHEALTESRLNCWPLQHEVPSLQAAVACWPLDMESLLLSEAEGGLQVSPLEQALLQAVQTTSWRQGACSACVSGPLCPFVQNAVWLNDAGNRRNLLTILRRGELATGQRWSFRDGFSLVAELLVGETEDYAGAEHPCQWVHEQVSYLNEAGVHPDRAVSASYNLVSRLYPYALFPVLVTGALPPNARELSETAATLDDYASLEDSWSPTHIRALLRDKLAPRLDPALMSPSDPDHVLALLEYDYGQSVSHANLRWPTEAGMSTVERAFFDFAARADELDILGRDSGQVAAAQRFIRVLCSSFAKRSVGVRLGFHADDEYVAEYERSIRNPVKLRELSTSLRTLLGEGGFQFNALESFGQPRLKKWPVSLEGAPAQVFIQPAPLASVGAPTHDLPAIRISGHAIPLTFDLFVALRLQKEGCANSSLPASVRASIDHIRHLLAGGLCRDKTKFMYENVRFVVRRHGTISLAPAGDSTSFYPEGE